ncbi:MAG: 30S ribosome-binding factor RbfA [Syntrophomonadaceae bacterium]
MGKRRQERMAVEIKRVLAAIVHEHMKDPRIEGKAVSITRVDVAQDISHARIYFSILGTEEEQAAAMQALQKARGYIRSELAHAIQVRHAPELEFRLDHSIEHGIKISTLLDSLAQEAEAEENADE